MRVHCINCFGPVVNSRYLASVPITVTSPESGWDYKNLHDIQILDSSRGRYARLICEHDCGGEMFTAICSERNFVYLEPYAQLLEDSRADPLDVETPIVPIIFTAGGRAIFSICGARNDFPDLPLPAKQFRTISRLAPERGSPGQLKQFAWLKQLFRNSHPE